MWYIRMHKMTTPQEKIELMRLACKEKQRAAEFSGHEKYLYWKAQVEATMTQIKEWL